MGQINHQKKKSPYYYVGFGTGKIKRPTHQALNLRHKNPRVLAVKIKQSPFVIFRICFHTDRIKMNNSKIIIKISRIESQTINFEKTENIKNENSW